MRPTAPNGWLAVCLTLLSTVTSAPLCAQDLLIHDGIVVTSEGRFAADVLVRDGIIVELGQALTASPDVRRIDASDLLVLPGGVDPHVHLGGSRADDYRTGSMAALAGGITTISNFAFPAPGQTLAEAVAREAALIRDQALADVILHAGINDPATQQEQMSTLLAQTGQASVKVFMVNASFDANIRDYLATMDAAGRAGILTMVHTEDGPILARAVAELTAEGKTSLEYFPDSRPVLGEVVAMQRAVAMAEQTGAPIYAVHVSSERALRVAQDAQARGVSVFVETRPIYLHLTRERFEGPDRGDSTWDSLRCVSSATRTRCGPDSRTAPSTSSARIMWRTGVRSSWTRRRPSPGIVPASTISKSSAPCSTPRASLREGYPWSASWR